VKWTAHPNRLKAELWRGSWVYSAKYRLGEFSPWETETPLVAEGKQFQAECDVAVAKVQSRSR